MISSITKKIKLLYTGFILLFVTKNNYLKFKIDFKDNKIEKILSEISHTNISSPCFGFLKNNFDTKQLDNNFNQILGILILQRWHLSPFIYFSYTLSLKKIILPLPFIYLKIFENNGIKINFFLSNFLLRFFCLFYLFKFFFKNNLRLLQKVFEKNEIAYNKLFVYDDLQKKHLDPSIGKNLFEWIFNNFETNKVVDRSVNAIKSLYINEIESHNFLVKINQKKILNKKNSFLPSLNFYLILKLFFFNINLFFYFFIKQFSKEKFIFSFSFEEYFKCKVFEIAEKNNICKFFLFTTSNMNYKPLWAVYVENKKISDIFFINYSASYQYNTNKYTQFGINKQNWKLRYELDNSYIKYLKKNIEYKSEYKYDKNIYFSNSKEKIKFDNYIVVFDHLVWNQKFLARYLVSNNDFLDASSAKFLLKILKICKKLNLKLILKTKRKQWYLKKYHNFLKKLQENNFDNFDILFDKSVYEVSIKSQLCITFPFTSAAIMAKNYGMPSIYFDHNSKYKNNSKDLNYGIKTIFGEVELFNYLLKYKTK